MTDQEVQNKIDEVKKIWVGKQVKVKGKHPHQGEIGEVIDFKLAAGIGK